MTKQTQSNPYREKFLESLSELLYQHSFDAIEAEEMIGELEENIPIYFNPIRDFNFKPVYTFEVTGTEEYSHEFEDSPLFNKCGYLLDFTVTAGTDAISTIDEGYEIYLMDDMTLAVVYSCSMMVKNGTVAETATYRYRIQNGLYKYGFDFDAEHFVYTIIHEVMKALGRNENIEDEQPELY